MSGTGRELRGLLGPLRRAVTRAASIGEQSPTLSEAQVELLHTVARFGPLTTTELAARLHAARPTVSNLVKTLAQAGLLERELSPLDSRSVLIRLSPKAGRVLSDADAERAAVLQRAIDRLSDADQSALAAALPALARLLIQLGENVRPTAPGKAAPDRTEPAKEPDD